MDTTTQVKQIYRPKAGAASLCRAFLENEGWDDLFRIARGEPVVGYTKSRLTGKQIKTLSAPDFSDRIAAYRIISAYGYGRPAELARADDSGQSVTDALIAAVRQESSTSEVAE